MRHLARIVIFLLVVIVGQPRGAVAATNLSPATRVGISGQIRLRLEPFSKKNLSMFTAHYYIDTEYASGSDAPVIYFLGNEGEMFSLIDGAGFMLILAKRLHANFVALEHRYYGRSIPTRFPDLTAKALRHLTIKNALFDFRSFEHFAKRKFKNLRGPWITIGRSYGGGLSVWYRETYPNETIGAIAAAPGLNFPRENLFWDKYIVQTLGTKCVHDFHEKILDAIEAPYVQGRGMKEWKTKFNAENLQSDSDFLASLGRASVFLVQMKGPSALCPLLDQQDPTQAFIDAIQSINTQMGMTLTGWADQGMQDSRASLYSGVVGMRQWAYQTCTEIGDGDAVPKDPSQTIRPTSIANYETQEQQCMKLFGIPFTADPEHGVDAKYFKPLISADSSIRNVLITEDTADPTTELGVSATENQNPGLIIYPVVGAAHHQELSTPRKNDSQAIRGAREMILSTAQKWLQEYSKSK